MRMAVDRSDGWVLLFFVVALGAPSEAVAYTPVFGGPGYDYSTSTGYLNAGQFFASPDQPSFVPGRLVNDSGVAVGFAWKYISNTAYGSRAIRWSSAGTTELGTLTPYPSGLTTDQAYAVNGSGTVVGYADDDLPHGYTAAFAARWDGSSQSASILSDLGEPSYLTDSKAIAVNNSGTAVGYATLPYSYRQAMRWDGAGTAATVLDGLAGNIGRSEAYSINDSGTAVGYGSISDANRNYGTRAVRWGAAGTAATQLDDLGTDPFGSTDSAALAVNAVGTAVGYARKHDPNTSPGERPVRWDASGTAATELGVLRTAPNGYTEARAYDINDAGTAVGWVLKYLPGSFSYNWRAVRWDASGAAATELGSIASGYSSEAYAVNDGGIAVGWAGIGPCSGCTDTSAVVWMGDATAIDLNSLIDPASGWRLVSANGISNTGWITGTAKFDPDGAGGLAPYDRLFLLKLPTVPGDYNGNYIVDAADYTIWRDSLGSTTDLRANGDNTGASAGVIDQADYTFWKSHFGAGLSNGTGAAAAVPEPATLASLAIWAGLVFAGKELHLRLRLRQRD
jgi:Protein of unknown function (DUF3466)